MLGAKMPLIQPGIHRVLYWHDADQPLDFTTKDDVAAYTAAAALDDTTPRILRIAGDTVCLREIATAISEVSGERYRSEAVVPLTPAIHQFRLLKRDDSQWQLRGQPTMP